MGEKRCSTCGLTKNLTEFPKDKRRRSGVKSECKPCHSERNRQLYYRNKERYRTVQKEYLRNNPDARRAKRKRRRTKERLLTYRWKVEDERKLSRDFNDKCPLTGSENIHYDHFIPLATGHCGTYPGNIIPIDTELNEDKHANNPFEWIESRPDISRDEFNKLVEYLAELNGMTVNEFRSFTYWCFENKRTIDEIKADTRESIDIFNEEKDAPTADTSETQSEIVS